VSSTGRLESVLRVDTAWASRAISIGNPSSTPSSNHIPVPLQGAFCAGLAAPGVTVGRGGETGGGGLKKT
jgi:hypothetical protein